jgi:hypothetical protein
MPHVFVSSSHTPIWAHAFEAHWSIVDAARKDALIKTVTD